MKENKAIILAAGMGKRMNSNLPKCLATVYDKSIIGELISSLRKANVKDICIVIGHKGELVKEALKDYENITFAVQSEQLGTGHAAMQALPYISDEDNVLIVNGDMPYINENTLKSVFSFFETNSLDITLVTATPEKTPAYGRIIRNDKGFVEKIVEQKDANEIELKIKEVNYGVYLFKGNLLSKTLNMLDNKNASSEYYLTDTIFHAISLDKKVGAYILEDDSEAKGVNTRAELEAVTKTILKRNCLNHMTNGVTIISSDNTYIGSDVKIGIDTVIYPGVHLMGTTVISDNCTILPNQTIKDKVIPSNSIV